jgi:hypothetical protein
MEEEQAKTAESQMELVTIIGKTYGPYATGFVILYGLWFGIAKPEMEASRVNFKEQQAVNQRLETLVRDLEEIVKDFQAKRVGGSVPSNSSPSLSSSSR